MKSKSADKILAKLHEFRKVHVFVNFNVIVRESETTEEEVKEALQLLKKNGYLQEIEIKCMLRPDSAPMTTTCYKVKEDCEPSDWCSGCG